MRVSIISDTHGLLRPEVFSELKHCEAILHAGDINRQEVLDQLERIAPVYVVRGNNDREWAESIPDSLDFSLAGARVYMTHKKKDLPDDLSDYHLVVYGHSHQYEERAQGNTLLLNPGSCGPRRFHQAITMAIAQIADGRIAVSRIDIPHEKRPNSHRIDEADLKGQIQAVIREVEKGQGVKRIAKKHGMDVALVEQIVRLYVTHPGVSADGIMAKMGL